ncbi:Hypothetical protein R9X50_00289600 [Acrodontium crateriforme]|uniref:Uncharacterized protein n=1 Tax=Acrodontium crateriforme TaxID=150365 RepID=A0AAQ3RBD2_9PEZI|nr:Hypothetical protein R9X50_00289600 [Acrodontium crateriforme]
MAGSGDLIDFNVIESHKENIQALPSGRSAKALAQLYSPPLLGANPSPSLSQDAHLKERVEYEKELANIEEADDPLDVYDRYVKWTMDTYPSAQATPQSQLLPLLERATKSLQGTAHYKNDPRYLRIWLHYIRLFSDAPREVFVFLARHNIGESLALYYEEFAAWLENAGRWNQAEEIYKMGIEKEARPAERLLRKFGEFERRKEARTQDEAEPTSPALPTVRAALAAKVDPFAASGSPADQQQRSRPAASKKSKSKMAIFSDGGDDSPRPSSGSSTKGWDSIGSIADRKKENTMEAKPWAGETLKVGKTNGGMPKMMVFKDESSQRSSLPKHIQKALSGDNNEQQCVRNPRSGRMECVFVNLEAVYPNPGQRPSVEYCFEELRALHRRWRKPDQPHKQSNRDSKAKNLLGSAVKQMTEQVERMSLDIGMDEAAKDPGLPTLDIDLDKEQPKPKARGFAIFEDLPEQPAQNSKSHKEEKVLIEKLTKTLALNDENDENAPPSRSEAEIARKVRREERANRTRKIQVMDVKHIKNETKTIQLNLDSPTGPKIKRKKSSDRAEPTMTINTKEAMDEIYGIFNQPLASQVHQSDGEDEDEDDDDDDSDDEYTSDGESTGTGKLSGPPSEYGDETRNEILGSQQAAAEDNEENDDDDNDGRTDVTGWSDFTTSKHVPKDDDLEPSESTRSGKWEVFNDDNQASRPHDDGDLVTPDEETPRMRYVPVPPEDYEPPRGQYRDMAVVANNRLPFMTPIVEATESSIGTVARTAERDFQAKTPSRRTGRPEPLSEDDELLSSPIQEELSEIAEAKRKILQPIRTKSTKGTISLGQGTAQSQNAAKLQVYVDDEVSQKGPIIKDTQCNPMDPNLRQTIIAQLRPPLSSYEGYHEYDSTYGRTPDIRKYIKTLAKGRANPDKTALTLSLPPTLSLPDAHGIYTIKRELGAGTFAPVYLIENSAMEQENSDVSSCVGKSTHRKALEAIKMEDPPSVWEFYMLQLSHRRLGASRAAESIVRAHEMHLFRDEGFLVEEYRDQGTLLDLVNIARMDSANTSGGGVDELLAMWITVELLRTTEALHAKGIIHGDIKGDNVLVRFDDPGMETDWSSLYFPSGAHGWSSKGVCLIDFGRGIDMKHFTPGVGFIADWKTTEADCAEMRELRPWTYQVDYHGLAGIIHSLLFGKYMETICEKGASTLGQGATKTYKIRENLKRYWRTQIWSEVFQLLLNPMAHLEHEEGRKMPVLNGMKACREKMELWLEDNCEKGMGLQAMISRMEAAIKEKRRKGAKSS